MNNNIIFRNKCIYKIDTKLLGYMEENKQQILVFSFEDGFVDGTGYLELIFQNGKKNFIELNKDTENKTYSLEVKNSLLKTEGTIVMQIRIIQEENKVYKTETFEMVVEEAINATETIEEQYPNFVDTTNAKLLNIDKSLEDFEEKIGKIEISIDDINGVEV